MILNFSLLTSYIHKKDKKGKLQRQNMTLRLLTYK
jgi:hypothetical protein